ncbi:hypothetical protein SAMN05428959_1134 [Duganella sp. CF517]|uniref:hypothetical protein n=1 Tax=Duganella sp. CF517 TaxID=1881038 RepID=UPI0008B75340|nr:hypothetical protein [Duganella sp. CF517]SEO62367.1 hypothetical protein SAMN05428959_1134 [Duganella sp. CF517]
MERNKVNKDGTAAAAETTKSAKHLTVQIDLPGQPIQCWGQDIDKVTVLLRKHRDVVFDIDLCAGKTYTVWADRSEMYDAKNKKLIHPRETLNFKDGELLHIWVSRDFKGKIFLYESAKLIGSYSLPKVDVGLESSDPAYKPPPINIALKAEGIWSDQKAFKVMQPDGSYSVPRELKNSEGDKFLHIVELNEKSADIPKEILDFFKHGGEKEAFLSGGVATRNWIMNQIASLAGYGFDNRSWMKELLGESVTLKVIDHQGGRKMYAFISGSARLRQNLTAHKYSAMSTKVLAFTFGAGSVTGLRHAGWAALKGNFTGGGRAAIIFTIAVDVAEWLGDYSNIDPLTGKPKQDLTDLFVKIGIDVGKNLLNGQIVSWLIGLTLFTGGTFAIAFIVVGTVTVTLAVNFGVDFLDKEFGISEKLASSIRRAPALLEETLSKDYQGFTNAISQAIKFGERSYDSSLRPVK